MAFNFGGFLFPLICACFTFAFAKFLHAKCKYQMRDSSQPALIKLIAYHEKISPEIEII